MSILITGAKGAGMGLFLKLVSGKSGALMVNNDIETTWQMTKK